MIFSALKKSGSIEAARSKLDIRCRSIFSALKKSGSIEAPIIIPAEGFPPGIFRFEKKRLH